MSGALSIGVIGAGSYGTCLAMLAGRAGHQVTFWCRTEERAASIRETRENPAYLPGHRIADSTVVTADLEEAVSGKQLVLGVTPSHAVREVFSRAAPYLDADTIVVNAAKGLEEGTFDRIDQIYTEVLPGDIAERAAFLSGPTFAKEVAAGQPSAIVVASRAEEAATLVQHALSTERFRCYWSEDIIGVQIGGALKNVIAICAGISDGLGFGQNARAALITRGLAEISRIGIALGADPLTFMGLSGLGDLVLTCAGDLSRNRQVGLALGRGRKLDDIVGEMHMVAEGVKTTKVSHQLAARLGVEAPLAEFAHAVLYENCPAVEGLTLLMTRALKHERD